MHHDLKHIFMLYNYKLSEGSCRAYLLVLLRMWSL